MSIDLIDHLHGAVMGSQRRLTTVTAFITAVVVFCSCGTDTPATPGEDGAGVPTCELQIVDTIGIELGDSNYVLGSIMAACHGVDGSILVLDRSSASMMQYSSEGLFVRRIGGRGCGPGELQYPSAMACLSDGRIVVVDIFAGGLLAYSPAGDFIGLEAEITTSPPMELVGVGDSSFVSRKTERFTEDGRPMFRLTIGRHDLSRDPVVTYYSAEYPIDYENPGELMSRVLLSVVFAADREGNVFVSPMSPDRLTILGYDRDGASILDFERFEEPVEKTPGELEEEACYFEYYVNSLNGEGFLTDYEPDLCRPQVIHMGVDGGHRIWVQRGTTDVPTLDVFDYSGNLLFTATVPEAGEDGRFWRIVVDEGGILAYSENPEDYQSVFILGPPPEI